LSDLTELRGLPAGLECLDVQACPNLRAVDGIPMGVQQLILERLPELQSIELAAEESALAQLWELSLKGCSRLREGTIRRLLRLVPAAQAIDLGGIPLLSNLAGLEWPAGLEDWRASGCERLAALPAGWPAKLRRLELRGTALRELPRFPQSLDYIDLRDTRQLQELPEFQEGGFPARTVFLHGSAVAVDPALIGSEEEHNCAQALHGDIEAGQQGWVADNELKVILLGNGRAGKSSLVERWTQGEYAPGRASTHGVQLWRHSLAVEPLDRAVDGGGSEAGRERVQLNIWDFAGQDLYHNTHRLFLQSRAIYLLCVNRSGLGHDDASDQTEARKAELEEDVFQELPYWRDMIASLGHDAVSGQAPPQLLVQTKADRGSTALPGALVTSASEGKGIQALQEWVLEQARHLLGRWRARRVPVGVARLKAWLQGLKDQNDREYALARTERRIARPPEALLSMQAFKKACKRELAGTVYAERPGLLLERLHRSGFVYYDPERLADWIILDQRWAIGGVYAFTHRDSEFSLREELKQAWGRFTPRELAERSWDPAGYSSAQQELLLQFMRACGMAFELLKKDETTDGEAYWLVPGFLPGRELVQRVRADWAWPKPDGQGSLRLDGVSEADVSALIVSVGREWSRSACLWRWGGGWRAMDGESRDAVTRGSVLVDFQRPKERFTGALLIQPFGPEDPLLLLDLYLRLEQLLKSPVAQPGIQRLCERIEGLIPNHRQAILERLQRDPDERHGLDLPAWFLARLGPLGESPAASQGKVGVEARLAEGRAQFSTAPKGRSGVAREVAFSFAGKTLEEPFLDQVPLLLHAQLKELRQSSHLPLELLCYTEPIGEERLSHFTTALAKSDLILIFLSKKYLLESVYCIAELACVLKQHQWRLPDAQALVFAYDGVRLDGSLKATGNAIAAAKFEAHWQKRAKNRHQELERQARKDPMERTKLEKRQPVERLWYGIVSDNDEFQPLVRALCDFRNAHRIPLPRDPASSQQVVEQIRPAIMARLDSKGT
jgi:internalin A